MSRIRKDGGINWWSRLRTRMAMSYVGVTLLIVLLLEALMLTAAFLLFTRSSFLGYLAMERAGYAAQIYALQAAVQAIGERLNPNTTFQAGQAGSLTVRQPDGPPDISQLRLSLPYIAPGTTAPDRPSIGLLIDSGEQVVASSYPDRYPVSTRIAQALPQDAALIRGALAGTSGGVVNDTPRGKEASLAYSVLSRDGKPIGAVYIRTPAEITPGASLLSTVVGTLIPSSVAWLCCMLPIGIIFGVITTRGMIRRIERLAGATARFTDGDFSQRVPVSRVDEIGQLERQFNGMAEQIVDSFAQRQALAEQSARQEERARIEQEMQSARYIQQSLLPEAVPALPGWQIEPFYRPAREVGGDLYDFLPLPDGRIGIVIGDITGKGMPAALIMATTVAMIRAAAPGAACPGEVLSLVNNLLQVHISPEMFATCFYAILDPSSGQLRYANAGHDIPYLVQDGKVIELRATGMPLGLMPDMEYHEAETTIDAHGAILFYTDGLVEAHGKDGEMFSFPRLQRLMKEHAHRDTFIEFLLNELQAFTGADWDQEDDITLIRVRRIA